MKRTIALAAAVAGLVSLAGRDASALCSQSASLTQAEQTQRQTAIVARMNIFLANHFPAETDMRGEVIPEGRCLKENSTTIRIYALENGLPAGRARIEATMAKIGVTTVQDGRSGHKRLVASLGVLEKHPGLREVLGFINEQDEARKSRLEELSREGK